MKRTLDTPKTNSSSTSNGEEGADTAGTTHEKIEWNDALEKLLCEEAEKCMGMAWMHNKSEIYFSNKNNWLQIPIIIISTITGAASVGSSSLFPGNEQIASVALGGASIIVSILGLINSYFSFGKRAEGHRLSDVTFRQMHRLVNVEMSLPRHQRMVPKQILRSIKEDLKRLSETMPRIPEGIIERYKKEVIKDNEGETVAHPEITNGVHKVHPYNEQIQFTVEEDTRPKIRIMP
jgi:hypothetical protein